MYAFPPVRPSYETLWAEIRRCSAWPAAPLPAQLTWPVDVTATWLDPDYAVNQACGWPLVTSLRDAVVVVGAFHHTIPEASGARYRSTIVATRPGEPADFAAAFAAANSRDSLSGWISLLAALHGEGTPVWHEPYVFTGSHVDTLRLLRSGGADVASIDSVTLTHVRRFQPDLLDGLHVVGHGPLVPSLPIVVPAPTDQARLGALRSAIAAAVASDAPPVRAALADLRIGGFSPLDATDYAPLLSLVRRTRDS
jgi:ABC-type phosphate/phosphonate transport system substrate-binding protein